MRILFCYPRYDYGQEANGASFEELHLVRSLIDMGIEIDRFDFTGESVKYGLQIMNERLRTQFSAAKYDILIYIPFVGTEILEETWEYVEPYTKKVLWLFNDVWRFESLGRELCWSFDYVISDYADSASRYTDISYNGEVIYLPKACCTAWFRTVPVDKPIDVLFIGQAYGDRMDVLQSIKSQLNPNHTMYLGYLTGQRLRWKDYVQKMCEAKIILGLSKASNGTTYQIKARDFEAAAARAFLLTNNTDNNHSLLDDNAQRFSDAPAALDKIHHLLSPEGESLRLSSAQDAYDKVHRYHKYSDRFTELFNHLDLK